MTTILSRKGRLHCLGGIAMTVMLVTITTMMLTIMPRRIEGFSVVSSSPPSGATKESSAKTTASSTSNPFSSPLINDCPPVSPATGLPNMFYEWKHGQQIRYQVAGPVDGQPIVLVHGLFVNSDHWRHLLSNAKDNENNSNYRVYALDLWGCGYSDKPSSNGDVARAVNGENGRFDAATDECYASDNLSDIPLGSACGTQTRVRDVPLRHPAGSPYNFFSWSELVRDFTSEVVLQKQQDEGDTDAAVLICNSIGTISSLQAVMDQPELFKGVLSIAPNFRELHAAELPLSQYTMPVLSKVQSALRKYGQGLFDAAAKPDIVKEILMEPYAVTDAVDDTLVEVLLNPLLTEGASGVVFDTLSYSAGPLPEQQLQQFPPNKPVWVAYGEKDPWIPAGRCDALSKLEPVKRVTSLPGVGHCPHDEAPNEIQKIVDEFMQQWSTSARSEDEDEDVCGVGAGDVPRPFFVECAATDTA